MNHVTSLDRYPRKLVQLWHHFYGKFTEYFITFNIWRLKKLQAYKYIKIKNKAYKMYEFKEGMTYTVKPLQKGWNVLFLTAFLYFVSKIQNQWSVKILYRICLFVCSGLKIATQKGKLSEGAFSMHSMSNLEHATCVMEW